MPILDIPASGLSLEGSLSSAKPDSTPSIIGLTLSDDVIEQMIIQCVQKKQTIELSLGSDPKITYGTKSQHFTAIPDPFTHELYESAVLPRASAASTKSDSQTIDDMSQPLLKERASFLGNFFGQRLQPGKIRIENVGGKSVPTGKITKANQSATTGTDAALTALQASLASADAKKTANTTKIVKDLSVPAGNKKAAAFKGAKKNRLLSQSKLGSGTTRSMPTSPALGGLRSPAVVPTSVPLSEKQAEKTKIIRIPLIHQLALGPATEQELLVYKNNDCANAEFMINLEKVADLQGGKWQLKQKSFKELDVWKYNYASQADRQTAIDAAVRAYDKMRTDLSAPEWERLLHKDDRGTGKCLSKLQARIATGTAKPPKINVNRAEESGHDSATDDLFEEKAYNRSLQSEKMTRSSSQPPTTKSKKINEKEAQAKRLLAKPGKIPKSAAAKPVEKKSPQKDTNKFKSSEFVGDSDDGDDENVEPVIVERPPKKKLSAKPASKHARDEKEPGETNPPPTKKPKRDIARTSGYSTAPSTTLPKHRISDASHTSQSTASSHTANSSVRSKTTTSTSPPKSSPLATSPTNAVDNEDVYQSSSASPYTSTANKHLHLKRKAPADDGPPGGSSVKRHQKTSSSGSTSASSTGGDSRPPSTPSRATLDQARRFRVFYDSYYKLYMELSSKDASLQSKTRIAELLDMHKRLEQMKKDIMHAVGSTG